jgi:hypothetical protein
MLNRVAKGDGGVSKLFFSDNIAPAPKTVGRRGFLMLTQGSPNVITTRMICLACGGQMPLKLVEPAYDGKRVDIHVFTCTDCKSTEAFAFDRE